MVFFDSVIADLLMIGILTLIIGHTFRLHRQNRWFALDPLNAFWAGVFMVYVVQPLTFEKVLRSWHTDGVFEETLFWIFFGLVWIVIGYESRFGIRWGRRFPPVVERVAPVKLMLCGWLLIGLGLTGYWYLVSSVGGLTAWLAVPRGGTDWAAVSSYIAELEKFLPAGLTILLFQAYLHPSKAPKKIIVWVLAILMLFWLFYLGTRSRTILFTIAILSAFYLPRRKNPPIILLSVIFVLLFTMTNFQGYYRNNFTNLSFNLDQIDLVEAYQRSAPGFLGGRQEVKQTSVSGGLEFNCVMSVIELVPSQAGYNYGYGFLEIFTRPIPRAIWPEKIYPAMEASQEVLRLADLSHAYVRDLDLLMGPAFTYIGHWFYVGGIPALVFAGLLTGGIFRAIRTYYDCHPDSQGVPVLYALLLPIGFGEAAATPFSWIYSLPLILLPFWLVLRICREKGRRQTVRI